MSLSHTINTESVPNTIPRTLRALPDLQALGRAWGLQRVGGQTLTFGSQPSTTLTAAAWGDGVAVWWVECDERPTRTRVSQWLRRAESATGVRAVVFVPVDDEVLVGAFVPGTRELVARAFADSPGDIETLVEAGRGSDGRAEVLLLELEELLGRRPIGRAFVADFRRAWQRLADGWTGVPFEDIDARRELALITLSRLLFLAFVQARGWLDGRMHYLNEEAARVSAKGEVSVFKGLLTPLLFGVLNTPVGERSPRALGLGEIPYLNGGLFSEDPIEQRFRDRDVANPVLLEIFE